MKGFYFANLFIFIFGLLHIVLHFLLLYGLSISETESYQGMKNFELLLLGAERNLAELFEGFSLTMGVFMIFYGGSNLVLYAKGKELLARAGFLILWNATLCMIVAVLAVIYFPWPVVILFGSCTVVYIYLFIKSHNQHHPG